MFMKNRIMSSTKKNVCGFASFNYIDSSSLARLFQFTEHRTLYLPELQIINFKLLWNYHHGDYYGNGSCEDFFYISFLLFFLKGKTVSSWNWNPPKMLNVMQIQNEIFAHDDWKIPNKVFITWTDFAQTASCVFENGSIKLCCLYITIIGPFIHSSHSML